MNKEKCKNKGGRPFKEISQKNFENLCALQCTKLEICSFFEITDKTLEAWCKRTYKKGFSEIFKEKRGKGNIALRRAQFRLAEHNATMSIWLGKQYLGQSDTVNQQIEMKVEEDALSKALREFAEKPVIEEDTEPAEEENNEDDEDY